MTATTQDQDQCRAEFEAWANGCAMSTHTAPVDLAGQEAPQQHAATQAAQAAQAAWDVLTGPTTYQV